MIEVIAQTMKDLNQGLPKSRIRNRGADREIRKTSEVTEVVIVAIDLYAMTKMAVKVAREIKDKRKR